MKLLAATLDGIVIERPAPTAETAPHLFLDNAYCGERATEEAEQRGSTIHVPDKANATEEAEAQRRAAQDPAVDGGSDPFLVFAQSPPKLNAIAL